MRLRSTAEGTIIQGMIDPAETTFASVGKGQPLRVIPPWNTEASPNVRYNLKICPDGEVPDFVSMSALGIASPGGIAFPAPGCPVLLGGTVAKGDKLTVSGGKWIKATTGKVAILAASVDGSANDLIPSALIQVVA